MPSSIFNRPITVMCSFFSLKLPSPYKIGYCQRTFREEFECNFKGQTEQLSKHCRLRKAGLVAPKGWASGFLFLISLISLQAKAPFDPNQVTSRHSTALLSERAHLPKALQMAIICKGVTASIIHVSPCRPAISFENRNTLLFYVGLNLGSPRRSQQMAVPLMAAC